MSPRRCWLSKASRSPTSLAASTVRTEAIEQLQIIRQRILSRDRLLDMANRFDLYDADEGEALSPDDIVTDMRSRISIETSGGGGGPRAAPEATLVNVSFHGFRCAAFGAGHQRDRHADPAGQRGHAHHGLRPDPGFLPAGGGPARPGTGGAQRQGVAVPGGEPRRLAREPRVPPQPADLAAGAHDGDRPRARAAAGPQAQSRDALRRDRLDRLAAERGGDEPRGAPAAEPARGICRKRRGHERSEPADADADPADRLAGKGRGGADRGGNRRGGVCRR